MRSVAEIEEWLEPMQPLVGGPLDQAGAFLAAGEEILENWITAHGGTPTDRSHEGFRILSLHRQAAKGDPSFNACRETCREVAYHYNLIKAEDSEREIETTLEMMRMVTKHLALFIGGKLQEAGIGEFCCSSKGLRSRDQALTAVVGGNDA